jgi:hypothetical protein
MSLSPYVASRLCFVIEATASMHPYWSELRASYLDPILRVVERKANYGPVELSLVLMYTRDHTSEQAVESSMWCTSVSSMRTLLDGVQFFGGGYGAVALSAALEQVVYLQGLPSQLASAPRDTLLPCQCVVVGFGMPDKRACCVPGLTNPNPIKPNLPHHHTLVSRYDAVWWVFGVRWGG